MPVYLCQPGATGSEPWRHGIQVYAAPFAMDDVPAISSSTRVEGSNEGHHHNSWTASNDETEGNVPSGGDASMTNNEVLQQHQQGAPTIARTATGGGGARASTINGTPIRRVRHAEVVLVDDVCIAFDRYWLRLRWPGRKGGFAGYIALGKVSEEPSWLKNDAILSKAPLGT